MTAAARLTACGLLLAALAGGPGAQADEPPPLGFGALARGFALPNLGRATILPAAAQHLQVDLSEVNEFAYSATRSESIFADGEATELAVDYRRGLGHGWEAGAFLPLLSQGGGFLEPMIEQWHDFWGLPNGARERFPLNHYRFEYVSHKKVLLNLTQGSVGPGDLQLELGRRLAEHLALRGMLQLPTGDASHLAGNGAFGGAAWLDASLPLRWLADGLSLQLSGGYSYTGGGQVLPQLQKHVLGLAGLGLDYRMGPRWSAGLQVYLHDSPYRNSELAPLTRVAAPLSLRLAYRVSAHTTLHIGFQEKFSIEASPDFGLFLGAAYN